MEAGEQVEEAEWAWLRDHASRDAVILVASPLDLEGVGAAVASDDSAKVGAWIREALLSKPTAEQLARWDAEPQRRFRFLVRRPYVLVQEQPLH